MNTRPASQTSFTQDPASGIGRYRFVGMRQRFPVHCHDYYVIGITETGTRRMMCHGREYRLPSEKIITLNPGDGHACEPLGDSVFSYSCLTIPIKRMAEFSQRDGVVALPPRFAAPVSPLTAKDPIVSDVADALLSGKGDFQPQRLISLLLAAEAAEPPAAAASYSVADGIETACRYVQSHYMYPIRLADVCRAAQLGKYTLLRRFKAVLGMTPYQYVEAVRLEQSITLLESGRKPVETALMTGFSDQSHFNRFFKSMTGVTPRQFQCGCSM